MVENVIRVTNLIRVTLTTIFRQSTAPFRLTAPLCAAGASRPGLDLLTSTRQTEAAIQPLRPAPNSGLRAIVRQTLTTFGAKPMVATRQAKLNALEAFSEKRTKAAVDVGRPETLNLVADAARFKLTHQGDEPLSSERALDMAYELHRGDPRLAHVRRPSRQAVDKNFRNIPDICKTVVARAALADISNAKAQVQKAQLSGRASVRTNAANAPENAPENAQADVPANAQADAPANAPANARMDEVSAARLLAGFRPINPLTGKPHRGRPTVNERVQRQLLKEKTEALKHEAYQLACDMYEDPARKGKRKGLRHIAKEVSALPRFAENFPPIVVKYSILQRAVSTGCVVMAGRGRPQILPAKLEDDIAAVVDWMLEEGYRVTKDIVKKIAVGAIEGTDHHDAFDRSAGVPTDAWFNGWKQRTSMTMALSQPLDTERSEWLNSVVLAKHYKCVADVLVNLNFAERVEGYNPNKLRDEEITFKPGMKARVFSMDETRVQLDQSEDNIKSVQTTAMREGLARAKGLDTASASTSRCPKRSAIASKQAFAASAVGGSNMEGKALPAYIVFNEPVRPEALAIRPKSDFGVEAGFAVNDKGAVRTNELIQWLEMVMLCVGDVSVDKPIVLILDGCGVHLRYGFLKRCFEAGVHVLLRPPHTSHAIQPEDLIHFKVFKACFTKAKDAALLEKVSQAMLKVPKLSSEDFMSCFTKSWEAAFTPENCLKGWRAGGYSPFTRSVYWDVRNRENVRAAKEKRIEPCVDGMVTNRVRLLHLLANEASKPAAGADVPAVEAAAGAGAVPIVDASTGAGVVPAVEAAAGAGVVAMVDAPAGAGVENTGAAHADLIAPRSPFLPPAPPGVDSAEHYKALALAFKVRLTQSVGGAAPNQQPKKRKWNSASIVNMNGGYATAPNIMSWGEQRHKEDVANIQDAKARRAKREKERREQAVADEDFAVAMLPKLKDGERVLSETNKRSVKYIKADDVKRMLRHFGQAFGQADTSEHLRELLQANPAYTDALEHAGTGGGGGVVVGEANAAGAEGDDEHSCSRKSLFTGNTIDSDSNDSNDKGGDSAAAEVRAGGEAL